jgi:hypothetical protein
MLVGGVSVRLSLFMLSHVMMLRGLMVMVRGCVVMSGGFVMMLACRMLRLSHGVYSTVMTIVGRGPEPAPFLCQQNGAKGGSLEPSLERATGLKEENRHEAEPSRVARRRRDPWSPRRRLERPAVRQGWAVEYAHEPR